jgi:hypothetical protein
MYSITYMNPMVILIVMYMEAKPLLPITTSLWQEETIG